jgi:Colon cancer-associated protein Mic1-like
VEQGEHFEPTDPDELSASTSAIVAPAHQVPYSHTMPHPHQPSEARRAGDAPVAYVTQADMYTHVFVPIEGRDSPLLDTKYVVGVITEYIRSLNFHHVAVTPFLYELLINFLVSNSRWYQLHQFLQYHVVSDSTHVACQLLSLEAKYPPAYQLALDMMKRLCTHENIVEVLISKNLLLQALRFMKSHRVKIPPRRILEAAVQLGDNTIFFHVFKFFESRKELTEDCDKIVAEAKRKFGDQKNSR